MYSSNVRLDHKLVTRIFWHEQEVQALARPQSLEKPDYHSLASKGVKIISADLSNVSDQLVSDIKGADVVISCLILTELAEMNNLALACHRAQVDMCPAFLVLSLLGGLQIWEIWWVESQNSKGIFCELRIWLLARKRVYLTSLSRCIFHIQWSTSVGGIKWVVFQGYYHSSADSTRCPCHPYHRANSMGDFDFPPNT